MTRWILRRFKHICAKANRKAKRNGHAAVPLLFAQKEPPQGGEKCCGSNMGSPQGGKNSRRGRRKKPRSGKGFNWIVRDCCLCALIRGLQNLEVPLKGFNCCGAKLRLRCADARFAKPRISLQRERVVTFCVVQKVTKKHTGRSPATSIQIAGRYVIFSEMTGVHQVTGYAENCIFPGIAGNDLNRCEVPALQHKIRAISKRTAVFFANSRLRVVQMGGGGSKRVALDGKKERFVRIKVFLYIKRRFLRTVCNAFCKRKPFGLRKRTAFSAHAKLSNKEKHFINAAKFQLPTATKLTSSHKFYPRQPTVSLQ